MDKEKSRLAEILGCPFCPTNDADIRGDGEQMYVVCNNCFAEGPTGKTYEEAVELWNRRSE